MFLRFLLLGPWLGLLVLSAAAQAGAPPVRVAPSAERWMLMARHGECAEVGTLKRRVPDLGAIADPESFATFMRQKGLEVTATQRALPNGKFWEVSVPARDLGLVFVTVGLCQSTR
jgi:hypothetical protein